MVSALHKESGRASHSYMLFHTELGVIVGNTKKWMVECSKYQLSWAERVSRVAGAMFSA